MLVHRRGDGEIGDGTKGSQVESAVVCGSILSYKSRTVETEDHVQAAKRHIVDNMVEGALCEG